MKLAFGLVICAAAFGQSGPYNAAGDALSKRVWNMSLLNSSNVKRIVFAGALRPKVCAAPLLRAPVTTGDAMRIVEPKASAAETSRDEMARVPAPACGENGRSEQQ